MRFTRCLPLLALAIAVAVPSTAAATAPPDTTITAVDTVRAPHALIITTVTSSEVVLVRSVVERIIRTRPADAPVRFASLDSAAAERATVALSNGRRSARLHPPFRLREPVPLASTSSTYRGGHRAGADWRSTRPGSTT